LMGLLMEEHSLSPFISSLQQGWADDEGHEVGEVQVATMFAENPLIVEWAMEVLHILKKPRAVLERWTLLWREVMPTPELDPVAQAWQDPTSDTDDVRRGIAEHIKGSSLAKKAPMHISVADSPTSSSNLLKSLAVTGSNKTPAISFASAAFLDAHQQSGWLQDILEKGPPQAPEFPIKVQCSSLSKDQLRLAKQVTELEKKFENASKAAKASSWETVTTMLDYLTAQDWWTAGPGQQSCKQAEQLMKQNLDSKQEFCEAWEPFFAEAEAEAKNSSKKARQAKASFALKQRSTK